ncbi:MAG: hypothetical protein R3F42_08650 [Pseudomonadota bacterium]
MHASASCRYSFLRLLLAHCLFLTALPLCHAADTPGPTLADVDTITILPVAFPAGQTAADRSENLDSLYGTLDDYIYKALLRKLALKGYVLDRPRQWSVPADWSVETLQQLTPQALAALAPASASYVAYLFVEQVDSSYEVVHSAGYATVSAMILQRESGAVVWQRGGTGSHSEHILQIFNPLSGPIGMLLTPDKHAAIEDAFGKLFAELPEHNYD